MRVPGFVPLALPFLVTACFSYQPTSLELVAPGSAVRVRISPEEADRLASQGMSDNRLLGGKLVSNDGQGLLLDTPVTSADATRGTRSLMQRLTIPVAEVREVELRQMDWGKTGLVAGGFAVVIGAVIARQLAGGSGRDDDPGGEVPDLRVPPVLRIRIPAF